MNIDSLQAFNIKFDEMFKTGEESKVNHNSDLFERILTTANDIEKSQSEAKNEMLNVLLGNSDNVHNALINMEKSVIQMQLATIVRDKTVNGLNQLLNMQI